MPVMPITILVITARARIGSDHLCVTLFRVVLSRGVSSQARHDSDDEEPVGSVQHRCRLTELLKEAVDPAPEMVFEIRENEDLAAASLPEKNVKFREEYCKTYLDLVQECGTSGMEPTTTAVQLEDGAVVAVKPYRQRGQRWSLKISDHCGHRGLVSVRLDELEWLHVLLSACRFEQFVGFIDHGFLGVLDDERTFKLIHGR
ncbi:hypothetical protein GNI_034770 [Gregarina niphandrodes]|uniref:Uncharacterized protein n=1 Tax=Gregarina niphandrodes TaxID=110365 RepID=A0A023BAT5_GRENI|nr:hypothetical protein GNI_034770 [Gregarina niphandrodes]EZG78564.1 hypothetical protein GNI_034770 [Gregarina niphandrodes]|eukprot:XP_011129250.1 hypothetical protein GNI_034770 [Gregarina niphandrodes]